MRARDHLMQAVNALYLAISDRRMEIDELRHKIASQDDARRTRITQLQQRETRETADAAHAQNDRDRSAYSNDVRMMREEETRLNNDFDRIKKETDAIIALKQRNIDDINQFIQLIERMWIQL